MSGTLMKCGCAAYGTDQHGSPLCLTHAGITPNAKKVEDSPPDLTGRRTKCRYCDKKKDSSFKLPFFRYQKNSRPRLDAFYCGCKGWD